jgi:hypothetical protein
VSRRRLACIRRRASGDDADGAACTGSASPRLWVTARLRGRCGTDPLLGNEQPELILDSCDRETNHDARQRSRSRLDVRHRLDRLPGSLSPTRQHRQRRRRRARPHGRTRQPARRAATHSRGRPGPLHQAVPGTATADRGYGEAKVEGDLHELGAIDQHPRPVDRQPPDSSKQPTSAPVPTQRCEVGLLHEGDLRGALLLCAMKCSRTANERTEAGWRWSETLMSSV